ncbi:hypothetical protein, partial [Escherichia coli]|uniref:hypothetical protein n=1 Tax=Escherichia coli TaxID=562 RepID=UPI003D8DB1C6
WKGWAISHRQKQKKLIMLPSETMIWQPEFTDKTLSRKPGAVQSAAAPARRAGTTSLLIMNVVSTLSSLSVFWLEVLSTRS